MIPNYDEFINNICNRIAQETLDKLKEAAEYFENAPEGAALVITLHHCIITNLMADFIACASRITGQKDYRLLKDLVEDTEKLLLQLRKNDT